MMIIRSIALLLFLLLPLSIAVALPQSNITELHIGESKINVHFESTFTATQKEKLLHWLDATAKTMTTLYGEFPVKQSNIHIYTSSRTSEPVPWGEVWKNGEYKINFHVNPNFSEHDFLDDWTAPHEFSHLFHPYPGRGNSWFGEGLASYYQNILRSRYGSMTEQLAFQKLYDGFQRGVKNQKRTGLTLKKASSAMRKNRSFMHVYWGGAAYFLNVDVRLRQSSQGKKSLDNTWRKFKECCLSFDRNWPLQKLIPKLDELSNSNIFSDEYHRIIDARTFPDYQTSFEQLGISVRDNKIILSKTGEPQALRHELAKQHD